MPKLRATRGRRGWGIRHSGRYGKVGEYAGGSYRGQLTQDYARVNVVYKISFRREINTLKKKVWNWVWRLVKNAVLKAFTFTGIWGFIFRVAFAVLERYIRRWFFGVINGVLRMIAGWCRRLFSQLVRPMLRLLRRYVPRRTGRLRNSIRIVFDGFSIAIRASVTWWYSSNRGRTTGWVDRVMVRIFNSRWFRTLMSRVWRWVLGDVPRFAGIF